MQQCEIYSSKRERIKMHLNRGVQSVIESRIKQPVIKAHAVYICY
jgi:hypothetical protein